MSIKNYLKNKDITPIKIDNNLIKKRGEIESGLEGIRTPGQSVKSRLLCLAELQAHS